ncbi:transposase family protein [Rhodococcus koreensis]
MIHVPTQLPPPGTSRARGPIISHARHRPRERTVSRRVTSRRQLDPRPTDEVPDPRHRRGVRHRFSVILAPALSATCAGARSFIAIAEWAHDAPAEALGGLGVSAVVPSESTSRRFLAGVDATAPDQVLGM